MKTQLFAVYLIFAESAFVAAGVGWATRGFGRRVEGPATAAGDRCINGSPPKTSSYPWLADVALLLLGFLASLAGLSVGVYLDPGRGGLVWQHKIIGIAVNMAALIQVGAGIAMKPPKTSNLRRAWNLTHWTLGRAGLPLGIADIFFGMYLSSVAYKNIIAQAVVLGGLFIIVMLKNDIEYLLVGITPAQEEERLRAAKLSGASKSLGMTNIQKSSNSPGYGSALVNNSNGLAPAHGAGSRLQTIV
ncbi:hypothetical protein WJX82_007718 [Trebouxia sp. C0006]